MEDTDKYVVLKERGLLYAKLHFDYYIPSFIAEIIVWIYFKIINSR